MFPLASIACVASYTLYCRRSFFIFLLMAFVMTRYSAVSRLLPFIISSLSAIKSSVSLLSFDSEARVHRHLDSRKTFTESTIFVLSPSIVAVCVSTPFSSLPIISLNSALCSFRRSMSDFFPDHSLSFCPCVQNDFGSHHSMIAARCESV